MNCPKVLAVPNNWSSAKDGNAVFMQFPFAATWFPKLLETNSMFVRLLSVDRPGRPIAIKPVAQRAAQATFSAKLQQISPRFNSPVRLNNRLARASGGNHQDFKGTRDNGRPFRGGYRRFDSAGWQINCSSLRIDSTGTRSVLSLYGLQQGDLVGIHERDHRQGATLTARNECQPTLRIDESRIGCLPDSNVSTFFPISGYIFVTSVLACGNQ